MRVLLSVIFLLSLVVCGNVSSRKSDVKEVQEGQYGSKALVLAFGSCNKHDLDQPLWDDIIADKPDVWVWLGDIIYGDTEDMDVLRGKYNAQLENEDYQKLIKSTKVVGVWDDHDYGVNDGGKEYSMKKESQQILYDFLGVEKDDPIRNKEGVYSSHIIEKEGIKARLVLLDARYFRHPVHRQFGVCLPNKTGDILGEEQWKWLEEQLKSFHEDLLIIGNGIQIVSEEHDYEKWANFPVARERLFKLIDKFHLKNVILLSGDRHVGELSKITYQTTTFYDLTSSGLTHTWSTIRDEANKHRVSPLVVHFNYGVIVAKKENEHLMVSLELKGDNRETFFSTTIDFN